MLLHIDQVNLLCIGDMGKGYLVLQPCNAGDEVCFKKLANPQEAKYKILDDGSLRLISLEDIKELSKEVMKVREFECKEATISVYTADYEIFNVFYKKYNTDNTTGSSLYAGYFESENINGYINSEKLFSNFLESKFGFSDVYSLNDFHKVNLRGHI
jgi:hypothetical protein